MNGEVDGSVILVAAIFGAVFILVLRLTHNRNQRREVAELGRLRELLQTLEEYAQAREDTSPDCAYIASEIQTFRRDRKSRE
jgi:hypothetical protein